MKLTAASQRIDTRPAVRAYWQSIPMTWENFCRTNLYGDFRRTFAKLFGPKLHTVRDSANRILDVWYVDTMVAPFWIICGKDRGTSYETLPSTTDEQCIEILKGMGELLTGQIDDQ